MPNTADDEVYKGKRAGIALACGWRLTEGSTGDVLLLFHLFPAFHEEIFSLLIVYSAQPEQALTAPVQGPQG